MLICFFLLQQIRTLEIIAIQEEELRFKMHKQQMLTFPLKDDVYDARLLHLQTNSVCEIQQRTVNTQTQLFTIIQENEFTDHEFEIDTPLNFRQFIGMTHIRDGMLAVTSDAMLYMLKFNYENIDREHYDEFNQYSRKGQEFASVTWKGDMQIVLPSSASRSELPQLVYLELTNQGLMIFSDKYNLDLCSAQIFSVGQMENQSKSLEITSVQSWIKREVRGLTKEIDGYVFSSAGFEGLDLYQVTSGRLHFMKNIQLDDLGQKHGMLNLVDYAIYRKELNHIYHLYLLDAVEGLLCVKITILNQQIQFKQMIESLIPINGGIAVDTKDGKHVIVGYYHMHRYYVREYYIDMDRLIWRFVNDLVTFTKIVDIEVTDELAIVQGLNSHQILFLSTYYEVGQHKEKIHFTHLGMRDFAFFKHPVSGINFFFGITATDAFLTQFQIKAAQVLCQTTDAEIGTQKYQLIYNTTRVANHVVEVILQHKQNIKLEIVNVFLFDDEISSIQFIGGLIAILVMVAVIFLCVCICKYNKELATLESSIHASEQHDKNQTSNKIGFDASQTIEIKNQKK